jgi:hypothetical protein
VLKASLLFLSICINSKLKSFVHLYYFNPQTNKQSFQDIPGVKPSNMNSESSNIDATNTSTHANTDYSTDNTQNETGSFNYAADNKRDNLRQGVSQPAQEPSTNDNSVEGESAPRESVNRDVENRDFETRDTENRDSNANETNKDSVPKKGIAGVFESNFGADKTTTSTFEKSQGEKYGEEFDETGQKLKGRFSVDETNAGASGSGATGGGEYTMGGKQGDKAGNDTNVPGKHGSHNGTQKEGFGHKFIEKAEGIHFFPLPTLNIIG